MKQLLISIFSLMVLYYPSISKAQEKMKTKKQENGKEMKMKQKNKMAKDAMQIDYPYTAEYSSQFEAGNPAYAKMVLEIWKDWDENQLERHQDYFADTVVYSLPSGEVLRGKDNVMAAGKDQRGMFSKATSNVEVWIPLKSVDRDENWVAVWGREEDTDMDGKVTNSLVHEIWRVNKDGKIDFIRQYRATPSKQ